VEWACTRINQARLNGQVAERVTGIPPGAADPRKSAVGWMNPVESRKTVSSTSGLSPDADTSAKFGNENDLWR
jgi:hypothetical protein